MQHNLLNAPARSMEGLIVNSALIVKAAWAVHKAERESVTWEVMTWLSSSAAVLEHSWQAWATLTTSKGRPSASLPCHLTCISCCTLKTLQLPESMPHVHNYLGPCIGDWPLTILVLTLLLPAAVAIND